MKKFGIFLCVLVASAIMFNRLGAPAFLLVAVIGLALWWFIHTLKHNPRTGWAWLKGLAFVGILFCTAWTVIGFLAGGFLAGGAGAIVLYGLFTFWQHAKRKERASPFID